MISWETVGVSAFITLIFAVAILLVIRKSSKFDTEYMNSISVQNLDKIFDERMERRNENADIRSKIHELDVFYAERIDELTGYIKYDRTKLDLVDEHIDYLDHKFNDVLTAKSVEQPEKKGNEK